MSSNYLLVETVQFVCSFPQLESLSLFGIIHFADWAADVSEHQVVEFFITSVQEASQGAFMRWVLAQESIHLTELAWDGVKPSGLIGLINRHETLQSIRLTDFGCEGRKHHVFLSSESFNNAGR
jgi:hypothetical protein